MVDLVSAAATARLYKLSSAQCIGSLQSRAYNIYAIKCKDTVSLARNAFWCVYFDRDSKKMLMLKENFEFSPNSCQSHDLTLCIVREVNHERFLESCAASELLPRDLADENHTDIASR